MKNIIILLSIFIPNLLFAQLVNDMKVNLDTNISNPKYNSKLSSNNKGNTVVTWDESNRVDMINVYAQIFDSSFNRVGSNFKVNTFIGYSKTPDVAVRKDGSFGIVWTQLSTSPYGSKILLKIYNKDGNLISNEIQINDTIKAYDSEFTIGTDSLNRFIIAFSYPNPSVSLPDIFYQMIDSNGVKTGNNVKVNQNISFGNPVIGVKKEGGFVISWWGSLANYMTNIYCQLFSPTGTPIGNNQQVNDIETGIDTLDYQELPDIAVDSTGNYIIGFKETPYSSGVARIKYQRFNKNGNKIGINKIIDAGFYDFQISSDEVGNLIFLFSAGGSSGFLYNLRIDKNDNQIGNYFLASSQFPNVPKAGNDSVLINKKFINLWRDIRLSNQPQVFLNVRSYSNPDSVVFVNNISTEIPSSFSLSQNFPNPFNPITTINFYLPKSSFIKIAVYDIRGSEIELLVNEKLQAGTYQTNWNGERFSSGVYFYRIQADDYVMTKRMVLIK